MIQRSSQCEPSAGGLQRDNTVADTQLSSGLELRLMSITVAPAVREEDFSCSAFSASALTLAMLITLLASLRGKACLQKCVHIVGNRTIGSIVLFVIFAHCLRHV